MDRQHPRGTTIFAGAQLRYLIKSAHGYLGAVGSCAAALYLKPRDAWMPRGLRYLEPGMLRRGTGSRYDDRLNPVLHSPCGPVWIHRAALGPRLGGASSCLVCLSESHSAEDAIYHDIQSQLGACERQSVACKTPPVI